MHLQRYKVNNDLTKKHTFL